MSLMFDEDEMLEADVAAADSAGVHADLGQSSFLLGGNTRSGCQCRIISKGDSKSTCRLLPRNPYIKSNGDVVHVRSPSPRLW